MRLFERAELLAHPRGARHLIDPTRLAAGARAVYGDENFARYYGEIVPVAAPRVRAVEAVSYTHLTLPTIYSV